MNDISVIGLDIAKHVFHVVGLSKQGHQVLKKTLRRSQLSKFFANLPACTIGIEGCATAHYWARKLSQAGHQVKLLPAQYVKAYVRGNKNDYNDALAIAEASRMPEMRTVTIKTPEQQGIQALQRFRQATVTDRTALCNQLRGLLAEFGIVLNQGVSHLRRAIPRILEAAGNELPDVFRTCLGLKYQQLCQLDELLIALNQQVEQEAQRNEAVKRLQTIPGFGPLTAMTFHNTIGDARQFRRGRDVSAAVGLVPRQCSSGGKSLLLGISKRGDGYLRYLLIHGARSVVNHAHKKTDTLSLWVMRLIERRGKNKAIVALANKLARIGWAVTTRQQAYQLDYFANQPIK